jgi:hypothetical protein
MSKGIALVALADGIGSSRVSQVASAAAVRGFLDDYYATSDAWSVRRAAQRVLAPPTRGCTRRHAQRRALRQGPRLCLHLQRAHLQGPRRAHAARGRRAHLPPAPHGLEQLTEDHRVHLSSAESYLGRALGAGPNVEIDYRCWEAEVGEVYLLATDGAYGHLDAAAVHDADRALRRRLRRRRTVAHQAARARGSDDDCTVQLLRIDELPAADAAPLPLQREGLAIAPPLAGPRMRFEGFTLVRELHVSSRSHVHLAVDDASGQQVVLKLPSVDLRDDPEYLDRFVLEEWVARRIDNVHVLKASAIERARGHLYVAMEYVDGQTLAQWMVDNPRPSLDSVRRIAEQLASGLQALHGKEMLHQDVRPENVMIDRTGTVRIIDLATTHVAGLADGAGEGRPLAITGTLQYTAPEYFTGHGGSARSDLFSMAVITYQMLTGQLPYGLHVSRVRSPADVNRLRYVPARHLRPDLPEWVDAVLQKALNPNPMKRQEAVSELAHDLRAPGQAFLRPRLPPLIERHPVRFWQTTTALLAIVSAVLLGVLVLGR